MQTSYPQKIFFQMQVNSSVSLITSQNMSTAEFLVMFFRRISSADSDFKLRVQLLLSPFDSCVCSLQPPPNYQILESSPNTDNIQCKCFIVKQRAFHKARDILGNFVHSLWQIYSESLENGREFHLCLMRAHQVVAT